MSRQSHSNPCSLIQAGAGAMLPLTNLAAAPAAITIGTSSFCRLAKIHLSCFGSPRHTHSTWGLASLILLISWSFSSLLRGRKGGE